MRTRLCSTVLAMLWVGGCDPDNPVAAPDGAAPGEANAELEQRRCRISSPAWARSEDMATNPWLSRGPNGPVLYARRTVARTLAWSDARRVGTVLDDGGMRADTLAWTGRRVLALTAERLESFSDSFEDRRLLRSSVPPGAIDPTLVELPGRAAIVGHRAGHGQTAGSGFLQFVSAEGEAQGPSRTLAPEGASQVRSVRARWDFGRIVVTSIDDARQSAPFWVLDPAGALLHSGSEGSTVACPRGGCLRVTSVSQGNSEVPSNGADSANVLQVEALDTFTVFTTNTPATTLRAVAVSGDRVLVMMSGAQGVTGCTLRVIDVSHREVVGDGSDFHDDGLDCEPGRVRPIARGFEVAVSDPAHGVGVRFIECGR